MPEDLYYKISYLGTCKEMDKVGVYKDIHELLVKGETLTTGLLKQCISMCVRDTFTQDLLHTESILSIQMMIFQNIKSVELNAFKHQFALMIYNAIQVMKIAKIHERHVQLIEPALQLVNACPRYIFVDVLDNYYKDLLEIIRIMFQESANNTDIQCKAQATFCDVLIILIQALPPDKRKLLTENCLSVWFSHVLPYTFHNLTTDDVFIPKAIQLLELITDDLVNVNYSQHPLWIKILTDISNKYLTVMKEDLQNESFNWARMWCVLVRLLKNQLTENIKKIGCPINNILRVLEDAFKKDVEFRCRAFECWKVLTNNLSQERDEVQILKRIKLLVIPLKTKNAKTEKVSLAKFDCWWHMIVSFKHNISAILESLLLPFLQFCFGPIDNTDVTTPTPGVLYNEVQINGVYALIEMFGHAHCAGCLPDTFPKLKLRVISTGLFVNHLKHWMHSLECSTDTLAKSTHDDKEIKKQICCLWSSCFHVVSLLPDNNVRKDVLDALCKLLSMFQVKYQDFPLMVHCIHNLVTMSFFELTNETKSLLKCKIPEDFIVGPFAVVISMLLHPSCHSYYTSSDPSTAVARFSNTLNVSLNYVYNCRDFITWMLNRQLQPISDTTMFIWTAFSLAVCELRSLRSNIMEDILKWPLKGRDYEDYYPAAVAWCKQYNLYRAKMDKYSNIDAEVLRLVLIGDGIKHPVFTVSVIITTLKNVVLTKQETSTQGYAKEHVQLLTKCYSLINNPENLNDIYPAMVDLFKIIMPTDKPLCDTLKKAINFIEGKTFEEGETLMTAGDEGDFNNQLNKEKENQVTNGDTQEFLFESQNSQIQAVKVKNKYESEQILNDNIVKRKTKYIDDSKVKITSPQNTPENTIKVTGNIQYLPQVSVTLIDVGSYNIDSTKKHKVDNGVNSPSSNVERPSRERKKSKKYENFFQTLSAKKRRNMINGTDLTNDNVTIEKEQTKRNSVQDESITISDSMPNEDKGCLAVNHTITADDKCKTTAKDDNRDPDSQDYVQCDIVSEEKNENRPLVDRNMIENETQINKLQVESNGSDVILLDNQQESKIECTVDGKDVKPTPTTPSSTALVDKDCKASSKKHGSKKSRIMTALKIDMVEGNPYFNTPSERRPKRKTSTDSSVKTERNTPSDKMNTLDENTIERKAKLAKKKPCNETKVANVQGSSKAVEVVVEDKSVMAEEVPLSEDFIESSQDSTLSTISVRSKRSWRRQKRENNTPTKDSGENNDNVANTNTISTDLIVAKDIEPIFTESSKKSQRLGRSELKESPQTLGDAIASNITATMDTEPMTIENSQNVDGNKKQTHPIQFDSTSTDLTATMDTEPFLSGNSSYKKTQEYSDSVKSSPPNSTSTDMTVTLDTEPVLTIIVVSDSDHVAQSVDIISENAIVCVGPENQEIADADTEPLDSLPFAPNQVSSDSVSKKLATNETSLENVNRIDLDNSQTGVSSPFKDQEQRNNDFLNNTLDISPIKLTSPERENNKTPSPVKSEDESYDVIRLSSPVQINGEPVDNCDSPEMFTDDKLSPDRRDTSPPREIIPAVNNSSPRSLLSLKKNRPQMRSSGRAAQMLSLCQPDKLQTIITNNEKNIDSEEAKKATVLLTPARKNLKLFYASENAEPEDTNNASFLKFTRTLPPSDCSPSGPILKRKASEIVDDVTVSPASKRKRVSFHDPPVSTTVSVHKYIEPNAVRSPQSLKRQFKLQHNNMKSPKKLDTMFKLASPSPKSNDTVDLTTDSLDDADMSSLDQTPQVEVVKTSELNDVDPICRELVHCAVPIDVIASKLSSSGMRLLLVRELEAKAILAIGDLARLTELEINRLCIRAPKVTVAKTVLFEYLSHHGQHIPSETLKENETNVIEVSTVSVDSEVQTFLETSNMEVQTNEVALTDLSTQTDSSVLADVLVQTSESSFMSTKEVIKTCVKEREDYLEEVTIILGKELEERISVDTISKLVDKKITTDSDRQLILGNIIKDKKDMRLLQNYLCNKFSSRDLLHFCTQILQRVNKDMPFDC